ncbi:hypothetical protein PV11_00038 [Exophiala sideris]|uniref:Uncharacterized protein n=1 Tax=Exophiala sideris TaxID=1016849 RepID=A0A0D1ZBV8_9EURO|nr:hypothetical protein PV11_00038 [Exophiala sideris]
MAYSINSWDEALATATSPPIYEIWIQASKSNAAATTFVIVAIIITYVVSVASEHTASRLTWAYARDDALVLLRHISNVHSSLDVPVWALIAAHIKKHQRTDDIASELNTTNQEILAPPVVEKVWGRKALTIVCVPRLKSDDTRREHEPGLDRNIQCQDGAGKKPNNLATWIATAFVSMHDLGILTSIGSGTGHRLFGLSSHTPLAGDRKTRRRVWGLVAHWNSDDNVASILPNLASETFHPSGPPAYCASSLELGERVGTEGIPDWARCCCVGDGSGSVVPKSDLHCMLYELR